jgi:hypothetical protein
MDLKYPFASTPPVNAFYSRLANRRGILEGSADRSGSQQSIPDWNPLKDRTVKCFVKGCQNLAVLWDSAWKEGKGSKISTSKLVKMDTGTLKDLYNDREFAKAMWLDNMSKRVSALCPHGGTF